ncbi:MAG: methyltransferase domain-containing protein [Bernardetiaceae bacterium]|nr:methyltransferase domain-containing protein [Bernardetiaceae bacterium]
MLSAIKKQIRAYLYKKGYDIVYVNHAQLAFKAKQNREIPQGEYIDTFGMTKVHYGCGWYKLKKDWLNVDYEPIEKVKSKYDLEEYKYQFVNTTKRHPFPDNTFEFGFSEDMVEHLMQSDSILFLTEAYRTLKKDGVLRLSFPGLEGVLKKHYPDSSYDTAREAQAEAYHRYHHLHFYSREEMKTVAQHIGFREVKYVEYGKSEHPELCGLDTRESQIGLNSYFELIK